MTTKKLSIRRITHSEHGVRFCLAIGVTVAVAACVRAPEPTHQTVEYYRANKEAREARVAECANDPGALGKTPDCINAKQAASIEDIGNLRDLPPMGLLDDGEDKSGRNATPNGASGPGNSDNAPREAK